jgi:phospholipid transport system substrate-binding protein
MHRLLLTLVLVCALPAPSLAAESAQRLLEETTGVVIETLQEERQAIREDPRRAYQLIDDLLMPHVDLPRIARFVLGRHWRTASEEQRARFTEEFRWLLLRTYGSALREYIDEAAEQARAARVSYQPVREGADPLETTVRSTIVTPDGERYVVTYRMHRRDGDWKVYDIVLEGVSLVSSYRSSISSDVAQLGIDGVIGQLEARNRPAREGRE